MQTATRSRQRAVVAAVLAGALVLGVVGIAGTACGAQPTAQGEAASQRAALAEVEAFAQALRRGQDVSYSAEYATAEGTLITIAQSPPQRAYRSVERTYVLGPDAAYLCRATVCQRAPGADAMPLPHAQAIASALGPGFVVAEHTAVLLARAASQPGARAGRAERVVAGARANCLAITAGGTVRTGCVSAAGVLAYFDGTTESGVPARVELRRYTSTVPPEAFELPAGAETVDVTAFGDA